ncbi:MAG: ArnT family glycosyltransferase [Candidatus Binatia bacterium]
MDLRGKLLQSREILLVAGMVTFGVAVRLIKISQPYVDGWSFKQGTIAMIAENFYRNGFNIFYPQVNWAGSAPGYMGTEFPLVPFLASLLYMPFGVQEWIGRSLSVFFFSVSLPFFYLLAKKISNQRTAIFAALIYVLAPLSIFASRSFMSDMASLSFSVMALYLFNRWLERSDSLHLLLAASLTTGLAILVKAPAVIIGLPLLYMSWEKHGTLWLRQRELWIFAGISLVLPAAWYIHAYVIMLSYPPHKFAGSEGMALADLPLYGLIVRQLVGSSLTPLIAAAAVVGLFLPAPGKCGRMFHWWLAALGLFAFFAGVGNRHSWYQLPAVPIAAVLSGRAFDFALRKLGALADSKTAEPLAGVFLFAVFALVSYGYVKPMYDPWAIPLREAGQMVDRMAPPDALAIFVADGDSSQIYYSRRKGWHAFDASNWGTPLNSEQAIGELETLRKRGAKYLVFTRYTVWWLDYYEDFQKHLDSHYIRAQETEDYVIFDLADKGNQEAEWRIVSARANVWTD